jgi:hypothetical protein
MLTILFAQLRNWFTPKCPYCKVAVPRRGDICGFEHCRECREVAFGNY